MKEYDTIGGFNGMLEKQKKEEGAAFDSEELLAPIREDYKKRHRGER